MRSILSVLLVGIVAVGSVSAQGHIPARYGHAVWDDLATVVSEVTARKNWSNGMVAYCQQKKVTAEGSILLVTAQISDCEGRLALLPNDIFGAKTTFTNRLNALKARLDTLINDALAAREAVAPAMSWNTVAREQTEANTWWDAGVFMSTETTFCFTAYEDAYLNYTWAKDDAQQNRVMWMIVLANSQALQFDAQDLYTSMAAFVP